MNYLRALILLLMAIALIFRAEGVWTLLTAAMLVTLNAPMMMIAAAAMGIGFLEACAWLNDYVVFHLLVYVASAVTVLLRLSRLIAEREGESP